MKKCVSVLSFLFFCVYILLKKFVSFDSLLLFFVKGLIEFVCYVTLNDFGIDVSSLHPFVIEKYPFLVIASIRTVFQDDNRVVKKLSLFPSLSCPSVDEPMHFVEYLFVFNRKSLSFFNKAIECYIILSPSERAFVPFVVDVRNKLSLVRHTIYYLNIRHRVLYVLN